ncbi:MAG: hypothetical protein QM755_19960 [Luteolibacter sp.]
MKTPPIVLTIFNRPDLAERVFEKIRQARPERLFVAADGPRAGRPGEAELCEAARRVTEQIDWPCVCERLYRSENLGCRRAMAEAITWFFERVEEGIILEDDCVPDATFFPYCAELLEKYRDNPDIAMISGDNFQPAGRLDDSASSYYFSKYPHIWGWASWRRFWRDYDVEMREWSGDPESLASVVQSPAVRRHLANVFDAVKAGRIDTWDFQLMFECLRSGRLAVTPHVNLVMNDGFDERATHTVTKEGHTTWPAAAMAFPLIHPPEIQVDLNADRHTEREVFGVKRPSIKKLMQLGLRKVKRALGQG